MDDAYKAYQDYCKLFNVPVPASKIPFGRYINKKYDLDTLGSSEKDISGKTVSYRYYPGLYQVKSPATAYAEFCLSYNTDVIGNTTDTPINTTDIIRMWISNIDSSKLNNTDNTDKWYIFLSSIVKELEEMYRFIHSCENPEDISYRGFQDHLSVVSVVCEENKSPDDGKNNTDANSSVLEDGSSVLSVLKDSWIKRGIVEEVSELLPDEPAHTEDLGFVKFKRGIKKRHCLMCERHFSYDLGIHYLDGYICQACQSGQGPTPKMEAAKPDLLTILSKVEA